MRQKQTNPYYRLPGRGYGFYVAAMSWWLLPLFALTALLYASVGFGGGSTYTALLTLTDLDHKTLPLVSLVCNLLVTTASVWHFHRQKLYRAREMLTILALSVPASFLGGVTPIDRSTFLGLLALSLLFAGITLLISALRRNETYEDRGERSRSWIAPIIGGGVGYLSGLVGIGGGIFLAPILHHLKWDTPKRIAALASAYIAANSLAALFGKYVAAGNTAALGAISAYWPLALAVILGGAAGRRLMTGLMPERTVKLATALLILFVAARLLLKWAGEFS